MAKVSYSNDSDKENLRQQAQTILTGIDNHLANFDTYTNAQVKGVVEDLLTVVRKLVKLEEKRLQ